MARKKENLEFRYYDIPHGEPLLALYGEDWIRPYGYDKNLKPIVDLHFHNLMEIGWCCYGAGEIILEGKSVPYRDGTLTVIPKNYPHTTNAAQANLNKWQYLFLDMDKTVQELYPDNHRLAQRLLYRINKTPCCTSKEEQPTLFILIRQIFKEMQEHGELYRESVSGLQKALVIELARLNQELIPGEKVQGKAKKTELAQISRALEYVGDFCDRPLKIGELAEACHMSETHFRRLFVSCMGIHPNDYINQMRIKKACELLKKTNQSVTEISIKCGFCSSATFNRNFRKFMGTTPNEWKKLSENYERRLNENTIAYHDGW